MASNSILSVSLTKLPYEFSVILTKCPGNEKPVHTGCRCTVVSITFYIAWVTRLLKNNKKTSKSFYVIQQASAVSQVILPNINYYESTWHLTKNQNYKHKLKNFYLYVSVTRVSPKTSLRILNHLPQFSSFSHFLCGKRPRMV